MAVTRAAKPSQSRALAECGVGAVPSAVATTCVAEEFGGSGVIKQTKLTLNGLPQTVVNGTEYQGTLLYTFPAGKIVILNCVMSIAPTTTSAIAGTINSGVTGNFGLGTATASNVTLATTMINIAPGTGQSVPTFVTSTVINVAAAAVTSTLIAQTTSAAAAFDGITTPVGVYLNTSFSTTGDIDADGTMTWAGTIVITWFNAGDL